MNSKNYQKAIATNKKARANYDISSTLEAGLILTGNEIKSIKAGKISLSQSYVKIINHEAYLLGAHIAPYSPGASPAVDYDPIKTRKLLLNKAEINQLADKTQQKSMALVPISIYLKRGRAKLQIGLAKGRKLRDKRSVIKKREQERELRREMRGRY